MRTTRGAAHGRSVMDASIIDRLAIYRNLLTLRDGTRVLLRLLDRSDKNRLQAMFAVVSDEDLKSMRDDIVGDATLHLGKGPQRHTAELRIFLSKPYRQRGLGVAMLKAMIDLAKKLNL